MSKKFLSLSTTASSIATFLAFATPAFADSLCPDNQDSNVNFNALCSGNLDAGTLVGKIITIIFVVVVIVALFYLIWGGFKWLTSGGDAKAVETARGHIIAAIIGLIIVFLSYFILNFVVGIFIPGFKINNFHVPSIFGNGSAAPTHNCPAGRSYDEISKKCE